MILMDIILRWNERKNRQSAERLYKARLAFADAFIRYEIASAETRFTVT